MLLVVIVSVAVTVFVTVVDGWLLIVVLVVDVFAGGCCFSVPLFFSVWLLWW